jgi:beta-N-acetylhexosaminidase
MKRSIILIVLLLFFCNVRKSEDNPIHHLSWKLQTKIFLWEIFYKNLWNKTLNQLVEKISNQVDDSIKMGQLIHTGVSGKNVQKGIYEQIESFCPGGIIFFKSNIESKEQLIKFINELQQISKKNCKIPLFFSIDQEWGRVDRIDFTTEFPSALAIGQTDKPEYAWLSGFFTGYEVSQLGINFIFAPVADINNNPENPVINTRSFGSDKERVSRMVVSYIEGMNFTNGIGFLKHFPGHGDTRVDSHLDLPVILKNKEELKDFELFPFIEGIRKGAKGVMIAHILYPLIDEQFPSTLSPKIVDELLKKELSFAGLIITDAMEMKAVSDKYKLEEASLMSLNAGVDIILLTAQNDNINKIYKKLKLSYDNNILSKQRIDESFNKQMYYKLDVGLWTIEELQEFFSLKEEELKYYKTMLGFKNQLSEEIYEELNGLYPDISYQISYDSIRALYKDFSFSFGEETISIFLKSEIIKEELQILQEQQKQIKIYDKNEFFRLKKSFKDDIVIYEIQSLEEWNKIAQEENSYKILIGLYLGNPFGKIYLKENQFIVASFSPTKNSQRAIIRKIFRESIPKANLNLMPLLNHEIKK